MILAMVGTPGPEFMKKIESVDVSTLVSCGMSTSLKAKTGSQSFTSNICQSSWFAALYYSRNSSECTYLSSASGLDVKVLCIHLQEYWYLMSVW